ncbi:MAG: flagellar biosynthesis regulator FlaF [Proteobacteria bacterium]|nr:flagellar biosynthesis regulator FlaF [Desulfobacteraceae bacterium]MBU4001789.1 flagellar biosynthesis regulator FlaF [Pseudomonadota bacterium]MBU4054810.1 flagellar biosynthesis regulator FlaF [Pseudomonadota bacterium]MBU4315995.1 flagellar biosynthesis regulator FlaF [Pseudomonadota bacterium]MBU4471485.1 flagellar biosynthesis regulator FlaF [Pseudomonadota bacterium]
MLKNPYLDYSNMTQETLSGRELEAHVLTKAANKLRTCKTNWNHPEQNERLEEALKYNQKIWSFFQVELSDSESALPVDTRKDLLNLSLFIDKHTLNVLSFPDPNKLNILIDINMNIASGLRET